MKKSYLLSLAVLTVLFTGCGTTGSSDSAVYVESDDEQSSSTDTEGTTTESTTTEGTTSSTVVTTSNNVVTTSNYSSHNQGKSCAKCHSTSSGLLSWFDAPKRSDEFESDDDENENESSESESGEDEGGENIFTSGATVFAKIDSPDYDAKNAAYGYTLRLILQGGEVQGYSSGRGTGNFNGTFNAGIDKYTAQVLDSQGNIVNTSATDSHDASRFDCNSCHTAGGNSGAPGRIVAYSLTSSTTSTADTTTTTADTTTDTSTTTTTTTDPATAPALSFANDVLPILDTKCASCHGGSGSFTITNSVTPYAGVVPFVDTANATSSSLLEKGSGTVGHAGGSIIQTTSSEYATIRDWISAGALDN